MGTIQDRRTPAAIQKAADAEIGISDFRRERKTFKVVADKGSALGVQDTEELCAAVLSDYLSGKLGQDEAAVVLKTVDTMLKREDQVLKRDELTIQAEIRAKTRVAQAERRSRLEPSK